MRINSFSRFQENWQLCGKQNSFYTCAKWMGNGRDNKENWVTVYLAKFGAYMWKFVILSFCSATQTLRSVEETGTPAA